MVSRHKYIAQKAKSIKFLFTDVDGVLTDTGVYYSGSGEELKRFSMRDGMGVERLKKLCGIETIFITGENSDIVLRRAEKLNILYVFTGVKNKYEVVESFMKQHQLCSEELAYIGDDVNDLEAMSLCGLTGAPTDAFEEVLKCVDFVSKHKGGYGAYREFAEVIIESKLNS